MGASKKVTGSRVPKAPYQDSVQTSSALWADAYEFLDSEGDREGLLKIELRILAEKSNDMDVLSKIIERNLKNHDRAQLEQIVRQVAASNGCFQNQLDSIPLCQQLEKIWVNNLDSIFFFEESAGKFEKARRLLDSKDCAAALPVLKEVEGREGLPKPLLEMLVRVHSCLSDVEGLDAARSRLEQLRIFHRGA